MDMSEIIRKIKEIKALFEPIDDVLAFVKNLDRQYMYINSAYMKVTHFRMTEIIYELSESFLDATGDDLQRIIADDTAILTGDKARTCHLVRLKDGTGADILMDCTKFPLYNCDKKIIGIMGVAIDRTSEYRGKALMFNAIVRPLSEQERHVLILRAQGKERAEVARDMGIDVTTFDTYSARIKEKLSMDSSQIEVLKEVCADLIRHGFVVTPDAGQDK